MTSMHKIGLAIVAAAVLVTAGSTFKSSRQEGAPPALPPQPELSPISLVAVQPFELVEPARHWYRKERPQYSQGTLLVLQVEPDVVHPRQTYEPVLYVGAETAQRVNVGHESGHLVVIVPGTPDLAADPVFFGEPALPEQIDAAEARRQLDGARQLGIGAFDPTWIASVTRPAITLPDDYELQVLSSYLVEEFSPGESDLVTGLRAPLVR